MFFDHICVYAQGMYIIFLCIRHYEILIGNHAKGCNLIRNTRRDMYGDDKFRAIELKYGNGSKSDSF